MNKKNLALHNIPYVFKLYPHYCNNITQLVIMTRTFHLCNTFCFEDLEVLHTSTNYVTQFFFEVCAILKLPMIFLTKILFKIMLYNTHISIIKWGFHFRETEVIPESDFCILFLYFVKTSQNSFNWEVLLSNSAYTMAPHIFDVWNY